MFIYELEENASIEIEIRDNENEIIVPSKVLKNINNAILLENIKIDDKVVVFNSNDIEVNLIYQLDNEKPIVWSNVVMKNINTESVKGILAYSPNQGIKKNRRNTYRIPLGVNGRVRGEKVIIHDISVSGISFRCKGVVSFDIGNELKIAFEANYETYTVNATIVRRAVEENGTILYGCKMDANINIDKLISIEQRKNMGISRTRKL